MNINKHNYEEWMVDHLEGNLSPAQEVELAHFLNQHPDLRAELEMFSSTILIPDNTIVYPDKESLKKKESRIIGFNSYYRYITAIAAIMLLFIAIRFIAIHNASVTGSGYRSEIEKPMLQKPTTQTDNEEVEIIESIPVASEVLFAEDKKQKAIEDKKQENIDDMPQPMRIIRMEQNEAEEILFAETKTLELQKPNPKLKVQDFKEQYASLYRYHFDNMMKQTQQQPTLVDRLNNTMALANDFGNMLGITKSSTGEEAETKEEQKVKTTSIKILDLEFYNRRKVNQ